jgi:hypothetical protein
MSETTKITTNIRKVFSDFLSKNVPKKVTNILWGLFNGTEAGMQHIEYKVDMMMRERNMLTAQHKSSLRSLSAENGFEPVLKIPAQGLLRLDINQSLYNKSGHPLFLPPFAVFTCKGNGLKYYYDSDKVLRLVNNTYLVPVVEGSTKTQTISGTGECIQRIYLNDPNIANNSISIVVDNTVFTEVKSFYDNEYLNGNKQFIVKFSNNPQTPIAIYIKGVKVNQNIEITYRDTFGTLGNLETTENFETEDIINSQGSQIDLSKDDITITNTSGFTLGSEGTDANGFKAAIGYNHGNNILFDNISYRNFLSRFSTLVIQNIYVEDPDRSIHFIRVLKKQILSEFTSEQIISDYKNVVDNYTYNLSLPNKQDLSNILSRQEFAISSHVILDPLIIKYAFQIKFENIYERDFHSPKLAQIIYLQFAKFFYDKNHSVDIDAIMNKYQITNDIKFEHHVLTSQPTTDSVIRHITHLPILKGDFQIESSTGEIVTLFNDINFVIKN